MRPLPKRACGWDFDFRFLLAKLCERIYRDISWHSIFARQLKEILRITQNEMHNLGKGGDDKERINRWNRKYSRSVWEKGCHRRRMGFTSSHRPLRGLCTVFYCGLSQTHMHDSKSTSNEKTTNVPTKWQACSVFKGPLIFYLGEFVYRLF